MSEAAKEEAIPTKISEQDRLRLCLLDEKAHRLQAEGEAAELRLQRIRSETIQLLSDRAALSQSIKDTYLLNPNDTLDAESGKITRGEKPKLEAVKPQ